MTTIPLSAALRARLHAEAPHLEHHTVEAHAVDEVDVVAAAALPAVDGGAADVADVARIKASMPQALNASPSPSHAPAPTLWRQVPHDDPEAALDGLLRAAVVTVLARGEDVDAQGLAPTIAAHLDVDLNLAGAIAAELHQQLQTDPALMATLRAASADEEDGHGDGDVAGFSPVARAAVVTVQRSAKKGGGVDG